MCPSPWTALVTRSELDFIIRVFFVPALLTYLRSAQECDVYAMSIEELFDCDG